jgi:molybdopterin converting factor small subunit
MVSMPSVTVELFGVPRLAAGQRAVTVEARGGTLADVARALAERCPALRGRVLDEATGWPLDGYLFALDERFTSDGGEVVEPGSSVLLVASAAGGSPTCPRPGGRRSGSRRRGDAAGARPGPGG